MKIRSVLMTALLIVTTSSGCIIVETAPAIHGAKKEGRRIRTVGDEPDTIVVLTGTFLFREGTGTVTVRDALTGKTVFENSQHMKIGRRYAVSLPKLPPGFYIASLTGAGRTYDEWYFCINSDIPAVSRERNREERQVPPARVTTGGESHDPNAR